MDDRLELNPDEMAQAVGGIQRTVDTGIPGLNAAIRLKASQGSKQIASLPTGTVVDTITDQVVYDPVSQRNYVEISFIDKNGKPATGWIAASIVKLPR